MNAKFKRAALSLLVAPALALPAAVSAQQQQGQQQQMQQQQVNRQMQNRQAQNQQRRVELRNWDVARLYVDAWSADDLLDTPVIGGDQSEPIGEVKDIIVGRDGTVERVIVEVGGWLEMGDQHIAVPWRDVVIGPEMEFVRVPTLVEVESGTYGIRGRVPMGEDVIAPPGAWRVNELIGDYASLEDAPRYGIVTDVIFSGGGEALGVVVNRFAGPWGLAGWYGYPYYGYYWGAYAYPLPYRAAEVGDLNRFDYVALADLSPYAGEGYERVQRQLQAEQRLGERAGAAAGGGTAAGFYERDVLRRVERELVDRGYDIGVVDGELDRTFYAGLREFQEQEGLDVTGGLNEETLGALDIER